MRNIEIPGYEIIVPNEAYSSDAGVVSFPTEEVEIPSTEILYLSRYRHPKKEDVIEYIRNVSKKRRLHNIGILPKEEEFLLEILVRMPSDELDGIASGSESTINHLTKHYPDGRYKEGSNYLRVSRGIIPNRDLDSNLESLNENPEIYSDMIDRVGLDEITFNLLLTPQGTLMERKEMDYLIDGLPY